MSEFNKAVYAKRRKEGLRGQGDEPVTRKFVGTIEPTTKKPGAKALRKNTKRARKAVQ
jgi:hypothetical protein